MTPKTYLGDSVYAEINEWGQIVLTTENGHMSTGIRIRVPREGYSQLVEMEMCTRDEIIYHFEKLDAQGRLDWCLLLSGFAMGSARRVEALEKQLTENPS